MAPLNTFLKETKPPPASTPDPRSIVGSMIVDSQGKCAQFLDRLAVAETSTDSGLDVASSVFSALGTAFTPLGTIHGLTAASSITSGWKTAIDSDLYAKATLANYSQAIQSNYYTDMKNYTDALSTANSTPIITELEYSKIQSKHAECSLSAAQSAISASLQAGTKQAQTTNSTLTFTITNPISLAANQSASLTVSSASFKTSPITINFPVPTPTNATTLNQDLAAADLTIAINANSDLQTYNITATNPSDALNTVVVNWPATLTVNWTDPTVAGTPVAGHPARLAPTPVGTHGAITTQVVPQATTASVPGHPTH